MTQHEQTFSGVRSYAHVGSLQVNSSSQPSPISDEPERIVLSLRVVPSCLEAKYFHTFSTMQLSALSGVENSNSVYRHWQERTRAGLKQTSIPVQLLPIQSTSDESSQQASHH